eukprot:scaffold57768_cov25-Tisochrysis_lutea.AAC.4
MAGTGLRKYLVGGREHSAGASIINIIPTTPSATPLSAPAATAAALLSASLAMRDATLGLWHIPEVCTPGVQDVSRRLGAWMSAEVEAGSRVVVCEAEADLGGEGDGGGGGRPRLLGRTGGGAKYGGGGEVGCDSIFKDVGSAAALACAATLPTVGGVPIVDASGPAAFALASVEAVTETGDAGDDMVFMDGWSEAIAPGAPSTITLTASSPLPALTPPRDSTASEASVSTVLASTAGAGSLTATGASMASTILDWASSTLGEVVSELVRAEAPPNLPSVDRSPLARPPPLPPPRPPNRPPATAPLVEAGEMSIGELFEPLLPEVIVRCASAPGIVVEAA